MRRSKALGIENDRLLPLLRKCETKIPLSKFNARVVRKFLVDEVRREGQVDMKYGVARFALHLDAALMRFDDAVGDG